MAEVLRLDVGGDQSPAVKGLKEVRAEVGALEQAAKQFGVNLNESMGQANQKVAEATKYWQQYQTALHVGGRESPAVAAEALSKFEKVMAQLKKTTAETEVPAKSLKEHLSDMTKIPIHNVEMAIKGVEVAIHGVERVAETARQALRAAFNPLTALGTGMFGGIASLFGLGFILKQTEDWDKAVEHLTFTMNGNAEVASKWMAVGDKFGISEEQMSTSMGHLSQMINTNSLAFKAMGIHIANSDGSLKTLDQVLNESTAWFREHANASNAASMARDLFGRSGLSLLPILEAEPQQVAAIVEEYRKLGLITDDLTLSKTRQFEFQMKMLGTTMKGLSISVGHELLPILAAFATTLAKLIQDHLQQFVHWLHEAVNWVLSLLVGLGILNNEFNGFAATLNAAVGAMGSTGNAMDTTAGQANNLRDQQDALRQATTAATDAITNQIKALEDEATAFANNIDDQIKALNEQGSINSYQDKLLKLNQKGAEDATKIAKLRSDYQKALDIGDLELAQSINDQLTAALQDQQNNELDIVRAKEDEAKRLKIAALEEEKKAHQEQTHSLVEQLRLQEQAIRASAQKAQEDMLSAFHSMASGINDTMATVPPMLAAAGAKGGEDFIAKLDEKGKALGEKIRGWWDKARQDGGLLNAVADVGAKLGLKIMEGMGRALAAVDWWNVLIGPTIFGDAWHNGNVDWTQALFGVTTTGTLGNNTSPPPDPTGAIVGGQNEGGLLGNQFPLGGIVPGPWGKPRMVLAHGGEEIRNRGQQVQGGGGPTNINIYVQGASDPLETARLVADKLNHALGLQ